MSDIALIVRRHIRAPVSRVFAAWTQPEALQAWWGPEGVDCIGAEIDLRVGGAYRIGNATPGGEVWIAGTFEVVDPPSRLVYSWRTTRTGPFERVEVRFDAEGDGTQLTIVHERIADEAARAGHEAGWTGCVDGLARFVTP